MSNKYIVSLGEVLLYLKETKEEKFEKNFFSNEAEILSILSKSMQNVTFLTSLTKNSLGNEAYQYLFKNLDNNIKITYKEGRQGVIYMLDNPIIDRKYSSFYFTSPLDFDFSNLFKEASWFHFSIDTLTVHDDFIKSIHQAFKYTKKNNVKVSVDFRSNNLYRRNIDSVKLFNSISKYVDILFVEKETLNDLPYGYKEKETKDIAFDACKKLNAKKLVIFDNKHNQIFFVENGKLDSKEYQFKIKEKGSFESYNDAIASVINSELGQ